MGRSIDDFIGDTPLVELRWPVHADQRILAKVEYYSPSGGPKDRVVRHILKKAEREGRLRPGMSLIEASTGSTGIATSLLGALYGYDVVIVMPEGMSKERRQVIQALGATLELTPGAGSDIDAALARVDQMMAESPGRYYFVDQFRDPANIEAHYTSTGPEIWAQTDGRVDAFVAMMGTGGTVMGVSRYLREQHPGVRCFTGEPAQSSTVISGTKGSHIIEGVGDGITPEIFDADLVDGYVLIEDAEVSDACRRLARGEGLFVGPSSAANVVAAAKVAETCPELKTIVTVLPDTGMRYLSTGLYESGAPPAIFEVSRVSSVSTTRGENVTVIR
jgi:cysteine synthase